MREAIVKRFDSGILTLVLVQINKGSKVINGRSSFDHNISI